MAFRFLYPPLDRASGRSPTDCLTDPITPTAAFTHTADCTIEFIAAAIPSAGSIQINFRKADANNYLFVLLTSAGNIRLREVIGGGTSTRAEAVGVLSGGEAIVITCSGTTITCTYDGTEAWSWDGAADTTSTDGEVTNLGTGGNITDLCTYPL